MYVKKILNFFKNNYSEYSLEDLIRELKVSKEDENDFYESIFKLMQDGVIYKNTKNKYLNIKLNSFPYSLGTIKKSEDGSYYVIDNNHYINSINENEIIKNSIEENDKIYFSIINNEVVIKQVIRKPDYVLDKKDEIICPLYYDDNYYILFNGNRIYVQNDGIIAKEDDLVKVKIYKKGEKYVGEISDKIYNDFTRKIFVLKNGQWTSIDNENIKGVICSSETYKENDHVICEIKGYNVANGSYIIFPIKKITGNKVFSEISGLANSFGWENDFPKSVENEMQLIPNTYDIEKNIEEGKYQNRVDRRNDNTFTIDPATAQDLDDAITIKTLKNGDYELYIDIADVANFIDYETNTAKEAERRGFTAYLGSKAFRMFPNKLSEDVCSLNTNGDKLTKTVKITYDANGNYKNSEIFNSIIKSKMQMTYDDCNLALEKGIVKDEYKPFYRDLLTLQKLICLIEKKMILQGKIDIENNKESDFEFDSFGNAILRKDHYMGTANKMIEIAMIQANLYTSKKASELSLPYIYRSHLEPSYKKINKFEEVMSTFSSKKIVVPDIRNSSDLRLFLKKLCANFSPEEAKYVSEFAIILMQRAYFDSENAGHYGLGLPVYGFFTSPIRRFSDYFNILVWDEYLKNGSKSIKMNTYRKVVNNLSKYLSERQIIVDNLEQDVNYLLIYNLISNFENQDISATIEFITEEKVIIRTFNNIIGVIKLRKKDIFNKEKGTLLLNGENHKIGDELIVNVCLDKNNKTKEIYFEEVKKKKTLVRKNN